MASYAALRHGAPRKGESPIAVAGAATIYATGVTFAWLLSGLSAGAAWLVVLHLASAFSFYWYWRRSWWGEAPLDCFGAALLLFAIAFRCIAIADTVLYGTRFDTWPSTVSGHAILQHVFMGEAITQIGFLLVVLAWRWGVRWDFAGLGLFLAGQRRSRAAWTVYFLAIGVAIGRWWLKISYGAAEQLVGMTYAFGVASILFIAMDTRGNDARSAVLALALGLPMAFLAMGSGMKENIFLPMVPAGIFAWRACRTYALKAVLILAATALLALSQLYVGYVRSTVWVEKIDRPVTEIVSGFVDSFADSGPAFLATGFDGIFSRVNLTLTHAITIALAEQDGFFPVEIFGPIPASFIPRALWPNKPVLQPGAEQTVRIRGGGDVTEVGTATASGFFAELYLGGSVFGVVLGAAILGFLQGRIQWRVRRFGSVLGLGVFNFLLFYSAVRFDEKHVVYAYTGMIFLFIGYLVVFSAVERLRVGRGRRAFASMHRSMTGGLPR